MKKICIALDTSPSAEKIAKVGYEYALALNAEVILVHATYDASLYALDYAPIMGYHGFLIDSNMKSIKDIHKEAEKFLSITAKFVGEPDLEIKVLDGETHDAILDFAKEWGADLLVIGTHSHSTIESLLMGNIAVKIVKHSQIPILVIPTKVL